MTLSDKSDKKSQIWLLSCRIMEGNKQARALLRLLGAFDCPWLSSGLIWRLRLSLAWGWPPVAVLGRGSSSVLFAALSVQRNLVRWLSLSGRVCFLSLILPQGCGCPYDHCGGCCPEASWHCLCRRTRRWCRGCSNAAWISRRVHAATRARKHTNVQSSARPVAETDVPFSHHKADTQGFFFVLMPGLCQFLAGVSNSDGETLTDCGGGLWPAGGFLRLGEMAGAAWPVSWLWLGHVCTQIRSGQLSLSLRLVAWSCRKAHGV